MGLDLTRASITNGEEFAKPAGVPSTLKISFNSQNDQLKIEEAEAKLNNLAVSLSGKVAAVEPYAADVRAHIAPTDLAGWEKFFPLYKEVRTSGHVLGDINFAGPLQNWRAATIDIALRATAVRFPILEKWIPVKDLKLRGIASVATETSITIEQEKIKRLSSQTEISLKDCEFNYGTQFEKRKGLPLELALLVSSQKNSADIRRAVLELGPLKLTAKGTIQDFNRPNARITFDSGFWKAMDMASLVSKDLHKGFTPEAGSIRIKGMFKGFLLDSKQLPSIQTDVELAALKFQWEMPNGRKLQMNRLSGTLQATNNSLSVKRLTAVLPNSDGTVDLGLTWGENPTLQFKMASNRLSVADFLPAGQKAAPPGIAPVGLASNGKAEDPFKWRETPFLAKLKGDGQISIKQADMGWGKASNLLAKISLDKLLWKNRTDVPQRSWRNDDHSKRVEWARGSSHAETVTQN